MKCEIIAVGKLKEEYFRAAANEYIKRLSPHMRVDVKEIPECKSLKEEGELILKAATGYKIALCVEGAKLSSEAFSKKIKGFIDEGKTMTFIIGSSEGLSGEVKEKADTLMSFSDMTFPHMLARVMLLEQLYRAVTIINGGKYHK
ncbi:MAG: 23S rRNA (pseudouridine(1915)-N(3))-methyltransferase RlmH [Clostridia bacterium]|nr:23S rRNA (pseudouridine(1915)-N(3))-methyltransferase RlmH [Clostridia bacterium]